ncbi:MAG: flagellar basal body rod protein FlgB [Pseudomonadota bacterium]
MYDDFFGFHAAALRVRSTRNELLARNLAHADTPGYQARDIDFREALADANASASARLMRTHSEHLPANGESPTGTTVKYRVPMQPSVDGNTVEADIEQAEFAENIVQYRASLHFINGKIRTMRHAISGER